MGDPLASDPVTFYDAHRRVSALVTRPRGEGGRVVLVYHDAPSVAAALPVLETIAMTVFPPAGRSPRVLLEAAMPEHHLEHFVYAIATLGRRSGRLRVTSTDAVPAELAAWLCGVSTHDLATVEQWVSRAHRPQGCSFTLPARAAPPARDVA